MKKRIINTSSRLLLIGLLTLFGVLWLNRSPQPVATLQSPLATATPTVEIPPDDEPDIPEDEMAPADEPAVCATKTKHCITFDYLGYETVADGTTMLHFRVTNHCTQKVKWVEIVSRQWERVAPAHNSSDAGDLGNYAVKWVNDAPTHPNRIGYRFRPEFDTFKQEASDTFSIQIENFNPHRRIRLRAKVGTAIERAGLRPIRFACDTTPSPTPTPSSPQDICLNKTAGQVRFDFYGYVQNDDGSTNLTFGVTNPRQRSIDAVGFKARSWSRVEPAEQSTYIGNLGAYTIDWVTHNGTPNQAAFRFKSQGHEFRHGASDQFTITVNDFDPTKRITAWARLDNQRLEVQGRLSEHDCDQTPPPPTPTPTLTPTPPFSPLPTPTPTPEGGVTLPTEPQVAQCVFGPPPGGMPPEEPIIPLSAYSFSEPTLVMTNSHPIEIHQWLPDNETLLVQRHTGRGSVTELVNTQTQEKTLLIGPEQSFKNPRWLSQDSTLVWGATRTRNRGQGYWVHSFDPPGERRLTDEGGWRQHDISPNGEEFIFMSRPGGTRPFIWNQERKTLRALPVDLANWRYKNGLIYPERPFSVNWHPGGDKILFWDGTWVFLYDLTTNSGCEIDPRMLTKYFLYRYIHEASWSPNGRYLLLKNAEYPLYTSTYGPHDLILILDTYTGESIQYALGNSVYSFSWAPDNQTVAIVKRTDRHILMSDNSLDYQIGIALFNIHTGMQQQVLPIYSTVTQQGLVWSPDGTQLAFLGSLVDTNGNRGPGGVQISQVLIQP